MMSMYFAVVRPKKEAVENREVYLFSLNKNEHGKYRIAMPVERGAHGNFL